jgi:hypothetical protein
MAAKKARKVLAPMGEFYEDLLKIDAWINARTEATQGCALLCSKLQERETRIRERLDYLAEKRGIEAKSLWIQVLKDEAKEITPDEIVTDADES